MERSVFRITGSQRESFLQGIVTNDVARLADGPVYAALLTPQGKYLADFILVRDGEAILLDAPAALAAIAEAGAPFASRGDDSGTHKKEMALWADTGVDPTEASGDWYRETGSGMGTTLNTGIGMGGYVMADRATWISFANKQDYEILVEGDADLFNQYGVIPVNPEACPSVNLDAARTFADWLVSEAGQEAIAAYAVDGQQLFFPNAPQSDS